MSLEESTKGFLEAAIKSCLEWRSDVDGELE